VRVVFHHPEFDFDRAAAPEASKAFTTVRSPREPSPAPKVNLADIEWLLALLKGKGWQKAWQLEKAANDKKKNERKIRAIASAAGHGIVSYPGSPGYKLWAECTEEEIFHALAAWRSQIRDNALRYAGYRRAAYAKFGGRS